MRVYSTFEYLYNGGYPYFGTFEKRFDTLPIKECIHIEYIEPVEEINCEIKVGDIE